MITAGLFRQGLETITKGAVFRSAFCVGAGYLEKLILEYPCQSTAPSGGELAAEVLRRAGSDLSDRIAAHVSETSP